MANFCGNCGGKLKDGYCSRCGNCTGNPGIPSQQYLLQKCKHDAVMRILMHIIINSLIWLGIGLLQIHGFLYPIGIWNIAICLYGLLMSYNIKTSPASSIRKWNGSLVCILVFCIVNLLLRSFLGFLLNLHMLYIRHIINKNKTLLCSTRRRK